LAHFATRLIKSIGHLHAVLAETLDDLVELIAQTLLVLSQRIGIKPRLLPARLALARHGLAVLTELALTGPLTELAAELLTKLALAELALALLSLLALLALLSLLAALTLLPLLALLRAEGAVEQLTLLAHQVA
jgi:hypothetical protein